MLWIETRSMIGIDRLLCETNHNKKTVTLKGDCFHLPLETALPHGK